MEQDIPNPYRRHTESAPQPDADDAERRAELGEEYREKLSNLGLIPDGTEPTAEVA